MERDKGEGMKKIARDKWIYRGILFALLLGLFFVFYHYYKDNLNKINENSMQLKELKKEKEEMLNYQFTQDKARLFINFFCNGDEDTIKPLVSGDVIITDEGIKNKQDNETIIQYPEDNYSFELNNYSYQEETKSMVYYYIIYKDETTPLYFMNITLKKQLEKWYIYNVEVDI